VWAEHSGDLPPAVDLAQLDLPARYEAEKQDLYESFVHPLTILSGLPSEGVGALLTLLLFGQELNLSGFVRLSCWSVS